MDYRGSSLFSLLMCDSVFTPSAKVRTIELIVTLDFLGNLQRTHKCGELRMEQAGQDVVLMGWVNRRRDHGNLIFLDLRDRTGITQIVLDKEISGPAHQKAEAARSEYVVAVKGKVRRRGEGLSNPNMATGEIEGVA